MKIHSDAQRFSRYESVVTILLSKDSFSKSDIYAELKDEERVFMGRVISELVRDGYLIQRHLTQNLLMERGDIDAMPIFSQ